jgi:hypothetical protein
MTTRRTDTDPLFLLARQRVVSASAELEVALEDKRGKHIVVAFLNVFKHRAAEAMVALVEINLQDPAEIPKALSLQNEVKRYDEWVAAMHDIIERGKALDTETKDEERQQLVDILLSSGDEGEREAIELGLIDAPHTID